MCGRLGGAMLDAVATAPEPLSPFASPGAVVAGKYRVVRLLGKGGMGFVVEARHIALDEQVALKFLLPAYARSPEAATRFLREARTVFKLKSEHVARLMDVATAEDGSPFMVLEYLEGDDLMRALKVRGPVPTDDAVDYLIQACDAIGEAHAQGIVHRDVKPSNLFLTSGRDGASMIKVLDFGISKVAGTPGIDALTRTATTMGSASYMSPEQMQSLRQVDQRTDIYALGVTLFTLLSGKHPYAGSTVPAVYAAILTGTPTPLRSLRPDVSDLLAGVIAKAYDRDPSRRYQSVAELVFALAPHAPQRSRATIDRIARLVGRPAIPAPREEAWVPPLDEAARMPGEVDDKARTRLLPDRPSAVVGAFVPAGAPTSRSGPAPSNGGKIAAIAVGTVLALGLFGAGALFARQRWAAGAPTSVPGMLEPLASDPDGVGSEGPEATGEPSAAEPGATAAPAEPGASASAAPPEMAGSAAPSAGSPAAPPGSAGTPGATAGPAATTMPAATGAPPAPPPPRPSSSARPPGTATAHPPTPPSSATPPKNVLDDR